MAENERILLADDLPFVLESVKGLLEVHGHRVVATAYDVEGVKKVVDDPDIDISLAIIDGSMPDRGDGATAAKYVREKKAWGKDNVLLCRTSKMGRR